MAIDVTVDVVIAAIRVGNTAVEVAEVTRLRDYAIAEIAQHLGDAYADADPTILNEAAIRLIAFLYDGPSVARGVAFANALRQSGASRMLYRFIVHRAGLATPEAATAQGVGTTSNPVVDVTVERGELVITYADGTTEDIDLPSGNDVGQTAIFDGRLPGAAVAFRMGWTFEDEAADATTFIRDGNHPDDGASEGTTAGLLAPAIPPALFARAIHFTQSKDFRFHVWIAGVVGLASILDAYGDNWIGEFTNEGALTVDGVVGILYSEIHSRNNEDGIYYFSAILPGAIIATQPWVETQIAGVVPGGVFGGVDQTARDSAATNATAIVTNASAIANLASPGPDPLTWAAEGNTDDIPIEKIPDEALGRRVYLQGTEPTEGKLGDVWIQDLTTYHPRIYEYNAQGVWFLDYTFWGGRVHFIATAHNIAMDTPTANATDLLLEIEGGNLKMYRKLNASAPPYWEYLGLVSGGAGVTAGSGGSESWHWTGSVTAGTWVANTPRTATLRSFPMGGYADYAALRAAVVDGGIKQVAIFLQQIDPGGSDSDEAIQIIPNIAGFAQVVSGIYDVFPAWGLSQDPHRIRVIFGAAGITVQSETAIAATASLIVRVGVWA